jgi:hypothetical protein
LSPHWVHGDSTHNGVIGQYPLWGYYSFYFDSYSMSEDQNNIVTLKVRVNSEFREKIVATAKENNRSMNAEIVARLEKSFEDEKPPTQYVDISKALGMIFEEIQDLKKNQEK